MRLLPSIMQLAGWGVVIAVSAVFCGLGLSLAAYVLLGVWLAVLALSALLSGRADIAVSREAETAAAAGGGFLMRLHLENRGRRPLKIQLTDHYPASFTAEGLPVSAQLMPDAILEIAYPLTASVRGNAQFGDVQLFIRRGLWTENLQLPCPHAVRVYPNFRQKNQSSFVGHSPSRGALIHPLHPGSAQGDFDHLRDYRQGDSLRRLDHKATARLGKPVSREYLEEFEQPLAILLDCSRRMQGGLLDAALAAAAALLKTAALQGDAVSASAFSAREAWYLPASRHGQYARFMDACADLHADDCPPDFAAAAEKHYRRQKKPSLTVLITTLEEGDGDAIKRALRLLGRRHHVIAVSLEPPYLHEGDALQSIQDAAALAARDAYANRFDAMQQRLRHEAVSFICCRAEALTPAVINAYWDYRSRLAR